MHLFCSFSRFTGRVICLAFAALSSGAVFATNVTMQTPFGDVDIELFDEQAPQTVANFLNYVNDGDYEDSFIHRSVPGFIVQGGGYIFVVDSPEVIPADPPVINEPGISNTRGTIAMAKPGGNPDGATSQWYINVKDNSADLDTTNGGYTVFGRVTGSGMDIIDTINELQVWNANAPFGELPLIDYSGSGAIVEDQLVMIDISESSTFLINTGLNDAWFNLSTAGQGFLIAVFPDRKEIFVAWFTFDTERPPEETGSFLGEPGHRWLTAQGSYDGDTATLTIYLTEGGVFDSAQPAATTDLAGYGTMTIEFADCTEGLVTYEITSLGISGEIPIQRITPDNVALCEELAGQSSD
jgi:cyclophilin family peptidyl-prolyl cis-trans isomerase